MRKKSAGAIKVVLMAVVVLASFLFGSISYAATSITSREKINDKYKWKLEDIYANTDLWNKDYDKVKNQYIPEFSQYVGKLNDKSILIKCFSLIEESNRMVDKLCVYAFMKSDEDTSNNKSSELAAKADMLSSEFSKAQAFISPELMTYDEKTIKSYFEDPLLKDYKFYIECIYKEKAHTLSKSEEELLAGVSTMASTPYEVFSKLSYSDMEFPKMKDSKGNEVEVNNVNYGALVEDKDRDVRNEAFVKLYTTYNKYKNTFASILSGEITKNVFFARAKKYESAKEAALQSGFIPTSVYDQLIVAANENLEYLHKYISLRKKVLNIDKVHMYDLYAPVVENYSPKITYTKAVQIITKSLAPLGKDYVSVLKQGLNSRWIDLYPTDNKYTGAYEWDAYDTHPYILMSYKNDLMSVITLGHELGHALNSYYTNKSQPYANANNPIFLAEVASTTNEFFIYNQLIKDAKDKRQKIFYLESLIDNIRNTFFTQVMFAEFEKEIHERVESGSPLSAESYSNIYNGLLSKYFGKDFEQDELSGLGWARIPHFYRNFYVYKYATSITAANQIFKNISDSKQSKDQTQKYLDFLKAGSSDYPIEILKKAGVDMTSPEPTKNLIKYFGELVDELDKLLD